MRVLPRAREDLRGERGAIEANGRKTQQAKFRGGGKSGTSSRTQGEQGRNGRYVGSGEGRAEKARTSSRQFGPWFVRANEIGFSGDAMAVEVRDVEVGRVGRGSWGGGRKRSRGRRAGRNAVGSSYETETRWVLQQGVRGDWGVRMSDTRWPREEFMP